MTRFNPVARKYKKVQLMLIEDSLYCGQPSSNGSDILSGFLTGGTRQGINAIAKPPTSTILRFCV
ncbi:MAG: hypothetical protein AMJ61_16745 [Desulfobacterales bacterium SG8_35_2]|nr:MAG: hypothetical protein AMJ61_16745 [Desulfobacterales bacterium SG8_35_2]